MELHISLAGQNNIKLLHRSRIAKIYSYMNFFFPPSSPLYILDIHACSKDKIRHKITATNKTLYCVLNYEKLGLSFQDWNTLKYRSVLFSFPEKLPLSYSPPKSLTWEQFQQTYLHCGGNLNEKGEISLKNKDIVHVNEYIEGVMIHLFYDPRISSWEIATKGDVGGKYSYYGNLKMDPMTDEKRNRPYFHEMFMEAFRANKHADIHTLPFLDSLPKNMCYIFILQHPKNRIALPIQRPVLYLIRIYSILRYGAEFISPRHYENWFIFRNMKGIIEFPRSMDFETKEDIETFFTEQARTGTISILPGVVITNSFTGEKTVLKNKYYDLFKKQKNMRPRLQYQYLCFRRMGNPDEYIKLFPNYKTQFYNIEKEYMNFITNVHQCYMDYYVFHKGGKKNFFLSQYNGIGYDTKYLVHIQNLHREVYLPLLRSSYKKNRREGSVSNPQIKLQRNMVLNYFDTMEPREMLYLFNWDSREDCMNSRFE